MNSKLFLKEKQMSNEIAIENFRNNGLNSLRLLIKKENNVKLMEEAVFQSCENDEKKYKRILYQTLSDISKSDLKTAYKTVMEKKVEWRNEIYSKTIDKIKEMNEYLVNPFEVTEGVIKCVKCDSMKTWSTQQQTRSCDEPMTTFSRCTNCGHYWAYSG